MRNHILIRRLSAGLLGLVLGLSGPLAGAGTVTYYHTDAQGSPVMASDINGNIIWRKQYEPYGKEVNGVPDDVGYTGHEYDQETGLTYMQARYYDPVGRFLSPDPVGFNPNQPMTFNRYSYANNNPYKYIDPDGRFVDTILDVAFIASDINDIHSEGLGWTNGLALAADVVGAVVPGVTGLGAGVKGIAAVAGVVKGADKVADAAKAANKLGDFKVASKAALKGVDEHAVKQSVMGEKASVKSHNISADKKGNVILTPVKKGGEVIETPYKLKELPKEFPKTR